MQAWGRWIDQEKNLRTNLYFRRSWPNILGCVHSFSTPLKKNTTNKPTKTVSTDFATPASCFQLNLSEEKSRAEGIYFNLFLCNVPILHFNSNIIKLLYIIITLPIVLK